AGTFDRVLSNSEPLLGTTSIGYLTFMCAGIIAVTILFTNIFGGFILLFDKNWGLLREILASPMPRKDLISGIILSGITKSWIQSSIITIFGLILGVSFFEGYSPLQILISIAGIFAFISLFAASFLSLSATIALRMDSPEGFQGITTLLTMPLFFVSNALYPVDNFPAILQDIAYLNPLTHLINGIRYFAIGDEFTAIGLYFIYTPGEILLSFGYLLVFAVIMFAIAWKTVEKIVVT
ncbi:MAG: ABC transporter permease, partial [Methanomicrobium sp.]|nr:ABC transporter permease [Methanomicrobium sp.]